MSSRLRTVLRIFYPIAILRLVGAFLCIFSYQKTRYGMTTNETYAFNLFQIRFNNNIDLSLYYTTAIGFAMLLVINYLRRVPSKARMGSMILSAFALVSLGNHFLWTQTGIGMPLTIMLPPVVALFELRLIFWKAPRNA
ncbi:MAG: hypothetical protein H8E15_06440 [Planctomycetes bacterium]|nr:hypothetical protein [Planctomycetota bacterium]